MKIKIKDALSLLLISAMLASMVSMPAIAHTSVEVEIGTLTGKWEGTFMSEGMWHQYAIIYLLAINGRVIGSIRFYTPWTGELHIGRGTYGPLDITSGNSFDITFYNIRTLGNWIRLVGTLENNSYASFT